MGDLAVLISKVPLLTPPPPPRAHEGRMLRVKAALNNVFLILWIRFEIQKSFNHESLSQTDPALTWFLTPNSPIFEALVFITEGWHGNGQNCSKPSWYMSMEGAMQPIPKVSIFVSLTTKKVTEKAQKSFGQKRAKMAGSWHGRYFLSMSMGN